MWSPRSLLTLWMWGPCPEVLVVSSACCTQTLSEQGEITRAGHLEGPCGHCSWGRSFVCLVKVLMQVKPEKQRDTSTHLTSAATKNVTKYTGDVISFSRQLFLTFHKHAALLGLTKEFAFSGAVIKDFHSVFERSRRVVRGDPTSCHSHA